ncbi:putative DNA binding protein [Archaeoglobus sulfaticallidus PM70-1]|uniref:Putative DNA binding protein n=1 Tax=Archaeoglobus sulfaticallidus PM70-1 TaxID=387631 RepID=N0BBA7_9EURY|nr:helix-turn-helix domain-containing protein [Archaeoglobus sulfaticallidus]AGK60889.1 putative DNA binding protein [Archaeoglobus sulfaticallidus PM70-1]
MELKRVDIKLWHPNCWSIETTKDHPEVSLIVDKAFKIGDEIRANFRLIADSYQALKDYIENAKNYDEFAIDILFIGKTNLEAYIHGRFSSSSTFYENIFALEMMPSNIVIHNGNEYWTILIYDKNLSMTLEKLNEIEELEYEVLGIENVKALDEGFRDVIDEISSSLSSKQKKVLIGAYMDGYFEYPKKTNLSSIANRFGIAKSTCLHHIRIAEQKILSRIIREIKEREPHLIEF